MGFVKTQDVRIPERGQIVQVRQRRYLIDDVIKPPNGGESTLVKLTCVDDDAQGQTLEVLWDKEIDAEILEAENWENLGKRGFDPADRFAAYINALRWNSVSTSDPNLFQSPFRSGIRIDPYQLEPLRKALLLPRVNLFIADDVGLGKTIEAGLIARELLLRRRVKDIVIACPPSMLDQWQDEMEIRFGLSFQILDRAYIANVRQKYGYGINPWNTHSRFLISHRLLIDPGYHEPLREWLNEIRPGSLFILDEAHHAAPSTGTKYAIDTKITRAIRDLAPRFEHRLFLSATPHNGHSNSFSALLEILDPQRFCRGVKVGGKKHLEAVMVRRLKEDLRQITGGFPKRNVEQIDIKDLPESNPELTLSKLLQKYRELKEERLSVSKNRAKTERDEKDARSVQVTSGLLLTGLQQRLLSSVEAFARTLKVHRQTVLRAWDAQKKNAPLKKRASTQTDLISEPLSADDERATLKDEQIRLDEEEQISAASELSLGLIQDQKEKDLFKQELDLLDEMEKIATEHRHEPDARVRYLLDWIQKNMCPGFLSKVKGSKWNEIRIIIFTEYDDTRRYLQNCLKEALDDTELGENRIEIFHGPTSGDERRRIKAAFNGDPKEHPVRILISTDAGREGLNFQFQCHNLFHFDVPWNPSRMEQRNGRIDRKLQPSPEVYCHYFVYQQRPEDKVLKALVRKTETIKQELGSLSEVLEEKLAGTLKKGIQYQNIDVLEKKIREMQPDQEQTKTVQEEFEESRERQEDLKKQLDKLSGLLDKSRRWFGMDERKFQSSINASLDLLGSDLLKPMKKTRARDFEAFEFPALDQRKGADPTWGHTLDTLRPPMDFEMKVTEWRRTTKLRPVVFQDPGALMEQYVQLHLEHPLARRLLSRFSAQGFIFDELSRACLSHSKDKNARVVLIGRLCLYGPQAARLHEEPIYISSIWSDTQKRKGKLAPENNGEKEESMDVLDEALAIPKKPILKDEEDKKIREGANQDVEELFPHLENQGYRLAEKVKKRLLERGEKEANEMVKILEDQRERIEKEYSKNPTQLTLEFNDEEKRQYDNNRKYWEKRLKEIEKELASEPPRIRSLYEVQAVRIEPVGVVYLWPQKA